MRIVFLSFLSKDRVDINLLIFFGGERSKKDIILLIFFDGGETERLLSSDLTF